MRTILPFVCLISCLSLSFIPTSANADISKIKHPNTHHLHKRHTQRSNWIIELRRPPILEGGKEAAIRQDQDQLRQWLRQASIDFSERTNFAYALNAISITLPQHDADLAEIAKLDIVKTIWPSLTVAQPKAVRVISPAKNLQPNLHFALNMTAANVLQSRGLTGKGIRVGIVDSGIDYKHPAFGGCSGVGPGCRVVVGYDFVGDVYDSNIEGSLPEPDEDPMDCGGHGTHVSGIVGGRDDRAVGVAPDVVFGAYRVFSCKGSASSEVIIAALEAAVRDRMDIINLSLGDTQSFAESIDSTVADRIARQGVIVVAAQGNEGNEGLWHASNPASGKSVIAVASVDNQWFVGRTLTVSAKKDRKPQQQQRDPKEPQVLPDETIPFDADYYYDESTAPTSAHNTELVIFKPPNATASSPLTKVDHGCQEYPKDFFAGRIALIRRGDCIPEVKVRHAQAAGASGVLIFNNAEGIWIRSIKKEDKHANGNDSTIDIPVAMISRKDGVRALTALLTGKELTIRFGTVDRNLPAPTGGKISSFSSWGLAPDLDIKPDIAAPGGGIFAAYPRALGSYAVLSGTSMATPHVAGAIALLLSSTSAPSRGTNITSLEIRRILQNSARPIFAAESSKYLFTPVMKQGAGLMQIDAALELTTSVTPAKLALGDTPSEIVKTDTRILKVTNHASYERTYYCDQPVASMGVSGANPDFPALSDDHVANVKIHPRQFSLKPGESRDVVVFITPNAKLAQARYQHFLFSGYVVIRPQDAPAVYVPYAGFRGKYNRIPIMHPSYGLPFFELKENSNQSISWNVSSLPLNNNTIAGVLSTSPLAKNETWYIKARFSHPVPKATLRLIRVNKVKSRIGLSMVIGKVVGVVDEKEWIGRNDESSSNYETKFTFNGTIAGSKSLLSRLWPFGKGSQDPAVSRVNITSGTYFFELIAEKAQSSVGMFKNWAWLGPVADMLGLRKQVEVWRSPLVEVVN